MIVFEILFKRSETTGKRKTTCFPDTEKKKDGNHLHVHESVVSVQAVLKRSRELGVSMTVFLTALFMMAINEEMSKMQKKKPVVLMVPVNLRKFFPSLSMLNFLIGLSRDIILLHKIKVLRQY